MKKILYTVFGLVLIALAAALVGPGFVNWNDYKADGAMWFKSLTGRDVAIDGDIKITILPAPALIANDIRVANVKGAANPVMARMKSLEVRIALEPLIRGEIQVETIRLVEPVIEIETFADGRNNLDFSQAKTEAPPAKKAPLPQPPPQDIRSSEPVGEQAKAPAAPQAEVPPTAENGSGLEFDLRLDNFVIVNGTVVYRDAKNGGVERLENINARIAAKSLNGPLESSGGLVARNIPFNYDLSIGEISAERATPFSLKLADASSGSEATVAGTLLSLTKKFKFKGALTGKGDNLAGLLNTAAKTGSLPGYIAQPFSFEGPLNVSTDGLDIQKLKMRLGGADLTGSLTVKMGKSINADLKLAILQINLNKLLAMPPAKFAAQDGAKPDAKVQPAAAKSAPGSKAPAVQAAASGAKSEFTIPTGINGSVSVSAQSLVYLDGIIREAQASAELANGEITISRLSAKLPGGGETALFGFITAVKGKPRFEGDLETTVNDLRKLLTWLKIEKLDVPYDRLRKLSLTGKVAVSPEQVQLGDMDIRFDSSRLTGGVTMALRARPSFGANLTLDSINLDAYLPSAAKPAQAKATLPKVPPLTKDAPAKTSAKEQAKEKQGPVNPLTVLNALKTFDANLMAHVKTIVYKGYAIKDAVLDATLFNGSLDVRRASVNKLAGASALISGKISNIGLLPEMNDINIQLQATDVSRLFKLAGTKPPLNGKNLGTVTLKGLINGSALRPDINISLNVAGGDFSANGSLSLLPLVGGYDGSIKAKHPNLPRLLRALDIDYKPQGKLGGLDIISKVKADTKTVSLKGIKGRIGPIDVAGVVNVQFDGERPKITADLQTGKIVIDKLMPAKRSAALPKAKHNVMPASWPAPVISAPASPLLFAIKATVKGKAQGRRWSTDPIDLSSLRAFDADIKLKSPAISFKEYTLEKADMAATVNKGILNSNRIAGFLFGGKVNAAATVYAAATPRSEASLTLSNLNVARALQAITGKNMASGAMDMRLNLATTGLSVANMVSGLTGDGSIVMKNVEVNKKTAGTALKLIIGLNKIGGGGGMVADITSSLKIDKGVARSEDIKLVSNIGTGDARGTFDLPNWLMDVTGEVRLSQNTLTAMIAKKAKAPTVLPFKINGDMDSPKVILDTTKMPGGALALPGGLGGKLQKKVNKLEKKLEKKGLGGFLNKVAPGLLGTKTQPPPQPQPQTTPAPTPQPQPQPQQPQKPEDVLKGFLKGLTR